MKILLLFTFTTLSISSGFSQTCSELQEDLLNIEYDRLTSKLDECDTTSEVQINCRYGESNNQTYAQVLEDYNKAMAKLVLHNGIESITAAIDRNHNSLANISTEKLNNASAYIDVLEENLTKAEVLEAAMTPVEGNDQSLTSFWSKYGMDENTRIEEFETLYRRACPLGVVSSEVLCNKIQEKIPVFKPESNIVQTLHAFMQAEMRARTSSSSNPESFYNEHREKLKIDVIDRDNNTSESITASEYRARFFGSNGKMKKMRDAVTALKAEPTDLELKANVLMSATDLDAISTSYAIPAFAGDAKSVDGTLHSSLQKPLIDLQIDLTDTFLTDASETSLSQNVDRVKADQAVFTEGLTQKLDKFVAANMQSECTGQESRACLIDICGINETQTTCNNPEINEIDVTSLIEQMKEEKELKKLGEDFDKATNCYSAETLSLKKNCLKGVANDLGYAFDRTSKQLLINEVEAAKLKLNRYNNASPFKNLTDLKILAIAALETNSCNSAAVSRNTCQQTSGVSGLDEGSIKLGQNLGNIAIRLNRRLVNDANGAPVFSQDTILNNRQRIISFRERCESDDKAPKHLCRKYSSEEDRDSQFEQDRDRNEESFRSYRRRSVAGGVSRNNLQSNKRGFFSIAGSGIAQGLSQRNIITQRTVLEEMMFGISSLGQSNYLVSQTRSNIKIGEAQRAFQDQYLESIKPTYSDAYRINGGQVHGNYFYKDGQDPQLIGGSFYTPNNALSFQYDTSFPVSTGSPISTPIATSGTSTSTTSPTTFSFNIPSS